METSLVYLASHTPEEIAVLAKVFATDLAEENMADINAAFAKHRQTSTRFPTPAHIIALLPYCRVQEVQAEVPPAIDEQRTPGMGKLVCNARKGDMSAKEALDKLIRTCNRSCGEQPGPNTPRQ